jgi:hypothetical protein
VTIHNWQSRDTGNQVEDKQKIHNAICDGHHYTHINTNNVNRTWAFIQSTGGKDEPNTVYITNQAHAHNVAMYRKHGLQCWSDVQFGSSDVVVILISECHTLHFLNKIIN